MPAIPATGEVEIRRMEVLASPGKKSSRLQFQQISQVWWYASAVPVIQKAVGRRIVV
jgi:hypothetical protein